MRAIVLVAISSMACAMSSDAFEARSMENQARNDVRYREAVADFKKRGYELLPYDDLMRFASLEEPGPRRCLDRVYDLNRVDAGPLAPDEPLRIVIGAATPGGEQPKPPVYVVAPAEKACDFFRQARGSKGELVVTKEDGQSSSIVHSELRILARAANGEIVAVETELRIVSTRKLLVKRTCDHMPRVEPDPLEHHISVPVLWGSAPKLRTVKMPLAREELIAECTDHTY